MVIKGVTKEENLKVRLGKKISNKCEVINEGVNKRTRQCNRKRGRKGINGKTKEGKERNVSKY